MCSVDGNVQSEYGEDVSAHHHFQQYDRTTMATQIVTPTAGPRGDPYTGKVPLN